MRENQERGLVARRSGAMPISSLPERTRISRSALDSRRWVHQVCCHSQVRKGLSDTLARSSSFQRGPNAANALASTSWTVTGIEPDRMQEAGSKGSVSFRDL